MTATEVKFDGAEWETITKFVVYIISISAQIQELPSSWWVWMCHKNWSTGGGVFLRINSKFFVDVTPFFSLAHCFFEMLNHPRPSLLLACNKSWITVDKFCCRSTIILCNGIDRSDRCLGVRDVKEMCLALCSRLFCVPYYPSIDGIVKSMWR